MVVRTDHLMALLKRERGEGGRELYIGLQFICFTVTVDLQTEL